MCFHNSTSMEALSENIVVDILSRLPIKTILHSCRVCKTWHRLLSSSYFAKLHLPRSPTSFMIQHECERTKHARSPDRVLHEHPDPGFLTIVQVEDEENNGNYVHDPLIRLDLTLRFSFRKSELYVMGSVNGLLCLWQYDRGDDNTLICNPLTQEYAILPRQKIYRQSPGVVSYGLGFSLSSREYKVVRVFKEEAEIYTFGTGKWRSLGHVPFCIYDFHGPFLNGYVHWFGSGKDSPEQLCSFDMETESFRLLPSPLEEANLLPEWNQFRSLGVIHGCLCECRTMESGVDIWVMKEYGIKKSWSKNIVIAANGSPIFPDWLLVGQPVHVTKGLKDGTVLFRCREQIAFSYSQERKMVDVPKDKINLTHRVNTIDYVPSFLKLGDYELENVHVF